jgi:hypothetical protein
VRNNAYANETKQDEEEFNKNTEKEKNILPVQFYHPLLSETFLSEVKKKLWDGKKDQEKQKKREAQSGKKELRRRNAKRRRRENGCA